MAKEEPVSVQISSHDEFLTVEDTAAVLNVTERWVRRAIWRRELPIVKMRGLVRIPRSAVDDYIRQQTIQAEPRDENGRSLSRVRKADTRRK
jgi:excisionase family DNA binding protein